MNRKPQLSDNGVAPLILYLLRHAIAQPDGTPGVADAERPLTAEGIQKMKAGAKSIQAMDLEIDRVWTSPYRRAQQTAEIVAKAIGLEIELHEALRPDAPLRQIAADLSRLSTDARNILLVGHQPHLGILASFLISGGDRAQLELKKGSLCKLTIDSAAGLHDGHCAELNWLLAPALLRR